jgi:hypothetical protein
MDQEIPKSAYHEAGHAVSAYIVGWSINSIKLEVEKDVLLKGVTSYDYGKDIFDSYENVNRRAICLLGGPIAQKLYEKDLKIDIDLLGPDGMVLREIQKFFLVNYGENFDIQEMIGITSNLLQINQNWQAVNAIVSELMKSKTYSIDKITFEEITKSYKISRMNF